MELQMAAERKKRAQVIQSEGEKLALLNAATGKAEALKIEAESQKNAKIVAAEAEKQRLALEAEGAGTALRSLAAAAGDDLDRAMQLQMFKDYINAQASIARSSNAKVLLFPGSGDVFAKASALMTELHDSARGSQ
eukprot:gb/GFBE01000672.1/.p1 GENE.gb/GFBE01000672.1/~~gb/GFBE01000672.1/.p1  ORF type:complete len:136 (+),score=41.31 gb/GFBE01000672.1/:1-408(+)